MGPWDIDYDALLPGGRLSAAQIRDHLQRVLPEVWIRQYQRMTPWPANILEFSDGAFEYLFDLASELRLPGKLAKVLPEDRVVAAFGLSRPNPAPRDASPHGGLSRSFAKGVREGHG